MEQLIKDLKELGYELVYDEFSGAWKVVDFLGSINDFLPSAFSAIVFKNGFIFSCGIALDDRSLVVEFSKL
jgi:hypothetical protein